MAPILGFIGKIKNLESFPHRSYDLLTNDIILSFDS